MFLGNHMRGTIKLSIKSNEFSHPGERSHTKKDDHQLKEPTIDAFYSDEMFYYMADMLLLRGQFYLKAFNNED